MRILHTVEFYHPSKGGAQEVVRRISEQLVRRGHEVTVATTRLPQREAKDINGVRIEEFDVRGNEVRGMTGEVDRYQDFLRGADFDVMMNYAAQQWATDLALPLLGDIAPRKVLVPCGFSGLYDPAYSDYFSRLGERMRRYDACVFLSHSYRDIEFAERNGVKRRLVIPNGASAEEFSAPVRESFRARFDIPEDEFLALHVGSHTGRKGHLEAIKAFRRSGVEGTLAIIGDGEAGGCSASCRKASRWFSKGILGGGRKQRLVVADLPRELTVAAYHEADLFLFPSNIECSPIVLFEAMASRTPFLTTDVGNAAEIIAWTGGGLLVPTQKMEDGSVMADVRATARMIRQLYNRVEQREELAERGHRAWEQAFTWEGIAMRYEELYARLVARD